MCVRGLLKEGVNSSACVPELWGLLGRVYAVEGQGEACKEAVLKQVGGRAHTARTHAPQHKRIHTAATAATTTATPRQQLSRGCWGQAPPLLSQ